MPLAAAAFFTPLGTLPAPPPIAGARIQEATAVMADNITTLTDTNFNEEVKGSDEPVLVDFWAEWCGPCKMIAPILEEIATEQAGKVRIAKLNVDDAPQTAQQFQVMSIPTLILFKDGEVQKRVVGARGKGQLLEEISAFL
jgi:thioredoxin 1